MEKAAEAIDWRLTDREVPPWPTSVREEEAGQRLIWDRQKAARAEEEDRLEASRVQDQLMLGFAKLAEYFADPGNLTVRDVRENVETLFGKEGMAVLNQVKRNRPNLMKRADTNRFHSAMGEPYHTVAHLVDLGGRLRQVIAGNEKRASARAAALEEAERPFAPARRESLLDPLSSPGTEKTAQGGSIFWPQLNAMLTRDIIEPTVAQLRPTEREKLVEKQLARIATPQHEQALRDINTRAMLEEMITNDPVLKGHHREDILNAFNEVSQLAPRASQQPLLMNGLLRQRLQQGALSPFESGDIVKTEQGLQDIGGIPKPPALPGSKPSEEKKGAAGPTSVLAR
jgi:hypothetical protein